MHQNFISLLVAFLLTLHKRTVILSGMATCNLCGSWENQRIAQGWRTSLWQQTEWENIVIVCSAGLTFWQCQSLTGPVGSSQPDSDSHQNPGWYRLCKHAVPGGTMCTCRGKWTAAFRSHSQVYGFHSSRDDWTPRPSLPLHETGVSQTGGINLCRCS